MLFFIVGIGIGVVRNIIRSRGFLPWGFRTSVVLSSLAIVAAVASAKVFGATNGLATAASATAALVSVLACGLARPEPSNGPLRLPRQGIGRLDLRHLSDSSVHPRPGRQFDRKDHA